VELDDAAGAVVGRFGGIDPPYHSSFAIAQDRAAGVTGNGGDGVAEPAAIATGEKHFAIDTAEAFGISVINKLSQVRHRRVRVGN
jgi:hypothetical protein